MSARRLITAVAVAGVALVGAACGDDGGSDGSDASSTTTEPSTTSTTPETTTPPTEPPTTVTLAPPELSDLSGPTGPACTTEEEAATSFFDAWVAGDPNAALRCGTGPAVATLFGEGSPTGPAPGTMFAGCFTDQAPVQCSYTYEGGAINLHVLVADATAYVDSVTFVAD